ncbi:MAG: MBL fold metallo-hydrolase, partial [Burkholderiales bacterium]|nr:MBL fold metallo-hydrolase [Burkholderiales bacterium]
MSRIQNAMHLSSVCVLGLCAGLASAQPSPATVAAHVDAAKRLAGSDLGALMGLCSAAPATRPSLQEAA